MILRATAVRRETVIAVRRAFPATTDSHYVTRKMERYSASVKERLWM